MVEPAKQFTKEDFENGTGPFEAVYALIDDPFEHERARNYYAAMARKIAGMLNFKSVYDKYVVTMRRAAKQVYIGKATNFDGQELELETGDWIANDDGVIGYARGEEQMACVHPILPVMRLVNVDTGIEKLKISYRKGKVWRSAIVEKSLIASNNSIVKLSDLGIAVTSENAKFLVRYLHDIENLNYERIPEKNSVGRLGWIGERGFSPYVENLEFDGAANYKTYFESVRQQGSYAKWLEAAREARKSIFARLALSASFGSVLVGPMGVLPFIVHLWGGSEAGKTVGLMVAASVWASPTIGEYIHTFNSTAVGLEMSAGFVNSMPLILDELQIVADKKKFDTDIYRLCEGVGKSRSNRNLGINRAQTWQNCTLSNGEMPITSIVSGGGAVNRILEIECVEKMFTDPQGVVGTVRANFGFAGRRFVEYLQENDNLMKAKDLFNAYYAMLSSSNTTEKQAAAGAIILTADSITSQIIFEGDASLKADDVAPFLQTKESVSAYNRNYQALYECVVQNWHRFTDRSKPDVVWGKFDEKKKVVYIVNSQYNEMCMEKGFEPKSLLSWMGRNEKIEKDGAGKNTVNTRINGHSTRCVALKTDYSDIDLELVDFDEKEVFG